MANEKRLIDKEKLLDKLTWLAKNEDQFRQSVICGVMHTIAVTPTVDAVEVVHGRWELYGNDDDLSSSYFCSQCGYNMDEDEYLDNFSHFKYCPNCGAKMGGDGNG